MSFNPNIGILPPNNPYAWNADRDALNVGKNFRTLGSYWSEQMSDDNKSQKLLDSYSPNDITYIVDKSGTKTYKCIINEDNKSVTFILDENANLRFVPSNIVADTTGTNFYKIELSINDTTNEKSIVLYKIGSKPEGVDPTNFVYDNAGNICWKLVVNTEDSDTNSIYFRVNFRGRPERGGRTHAKILSNISLRTNGLSKLQNAKNNILNDLYNIYITNGSYKFQSSQVYKQNNSEESLVSNFTDNLKPLVLGNATSYPTFYLNNEILMNGGKLGYDAYSGASNFLSTDSLDTEVESNIIYIYFAKGIELTRIYTDPSSDSQLKPETLLPGLDFIQLDNAICFINKNPYELFKDQTIYFDGRYLNTAKESESLYKGICNVEHVPCGLSAQLTANYINGSTQSVKDFELMLNALAGACILMDGPAKVIYIGEVCDKSIYYSQFEAPGARTDNISADYNQVAYSATGKNRAYYVLQNYVTKETFVVKTNLPHDLNCLSLNKDSDFNVGDILPQYYVFNSPIKLVYNKSNGKATKDDLINYISLFENVIYHKNKVEHVVAPLYSVKTIIPKFQVNSKKAFFSNSVVNQNISATLDDTLEYSYWYWKTNPIFKGDKNKVAQFKTFIDKNSVLNTNHSEGELILSTILPNALLVCLSNQPLEYLYMRQYIQSDYFKNKFPDFTSFIYFFNNLVKRFSPLSYIPIILTSCAVSNYRSLYINSYHLRDGITAKNVKKFFMLTDLQAFETNTSYYNDEFGFSPQYDTYRKRTYNFQ